MVYRLGAEGYSGQSRWYTDWEALRPMQLQRGVRLGSQTTYAAPVDSCLKVLIATKTQTSGPSRIQVQFIYSMTTLSE